MSVIFLPPSPFLSFPFLSLRWNTLCPLSVISRPRLCGITQTEFRSNHGYLTALFVLPIMVPLPYSFKEMVTKTEPWNYWLSVWQNTKLFWALQKIEYIILWLDQAILVWHVFVSCSQKRKFWARKLMFYVIWFSQHSKIFTKPINIFKVDKIVYLKGAYKDNRYVNTFQHIALSL